MSHESDKSLRARLQAAMIAADAVVSYDEGCLARLLECAQRLTGRALEGAAANWYLLRREETP